MKLKNIAYALLLMPYALLAGCGDPTDRGTHNGDESVVPRQFNAVSFDKIPGWRDDDVRYALKAFRNSCTAKIQYDGRVVPDRALFEEKCQNLPSESADIRTVRAWFESNFQPYQLVDDAGGTSGLFTGYYSPVVHACRVQTAACSVPVMDKPTDGRQYKGVPSTTIVSQRIGRPIFWINPVDLQDMGSATLILEDGSRVKVGVASTNDLPFNGIGGQLQKRGIKPPGGYNMKSVRTFLKQNPALANELIANNPRYVYYTQQSTFDTRGNMGVPLTNIRSIAMDKSIYTLGLPVFVDTKLTDGRKFQRLMVAQDTGGAIKGCVRADIYFGEGDEAFEYAQGQYQQGSMYILMPKVYKYVKPK